MSRDAAWQDVFEFIELFYLPRRKHTHKGMLSPADFKTGQQKLNEAGFHKSRDTFPATGRRTSTERHPPPALIPPSNLRRP